MKIFNTLTRQKEEFVPVKEGKAGIYACGPTVYNYAHIGNMRTYVFMDILRRALKLNGYKLKHVMNITDVGHLASDADTGEDKMLKGAKRENKSVMDLFREFYGLQNGGQEPSEKHISVIEEILKEMEAHANEAD